MTQEKGACKSYLIKSHWRLTQPEPILVSAAVFYGIAFLSLLGGMQVHGNASLYPNQFAKSTHTGDSVERDKDCKEQRFSSWKNNSVVEPGLKASNLSARIYGAVHYARGPHC